MSGQWQPIENAPKDGTIVLLAGGVWGDDLIAARRWDDNDQEILIGPKVGAARWLPYPYQDGQNGHWIVAAMENGCCCAEYENPTHWMPLPEPPA